MKKPILTVLLLTYNHEDSIAAAIDSVLKQETSYPYIIWILEDCSTDKTLKICKDYAKQYPEKIILKTQASNTKGRHVLEARKKLKTDFFATLEGDDRWCSSKKIQLALDTLNKNPEYVMFGHDTLVNHVTTEEQQSLVHDVHRVNFKNPVTFDSNPRLLHNSARVYRRVIDFNKDPVVGDIFTFYAFLDKGPLYYHDEIMSVYNSTGNGIWSKLSRAEQVKRTEKSQYKCNRITDFRHDDFFTGRVTRPPELKRLKKIFGVKLGWRLYLYQTSIKNGLITK